ncbi:hypothetical protein DDE83_006907 [Stemphylium lycopersici]|uniref:Uncharacterized protein n=1 Tax=Stemphylium lycopersici TaxID=183478 RepID=A0A364MXJ0_STELY|nr:hypothetical protein DDE83_006907 [Stemphylium lycopersici]
MKKHQSTIKRLGRSSSPQSLITLHEIGSPHILSYDYYTTAKTGQQALDLSGIATLIPHPSDIPHIFEKGYPYNHTPEYELVGYAHNIPESGLSSLRPLSPSTPEHIVFQEQISAAQSVECKLCPWMWYGERPTSTEHMIDPIASANLPMGHWDAPNIAMTVPSYQSMDLQSHMIFEQPHILKTLASHHDMYPFSGNQLSPENYSLDPTLDWITGQPTHAERNTVTSVPFLPEMQHDWEDVFIFGPSLCQNF